MGLFNIFKKRTVMSQDTPEKDNTLTMQSKTYTCVKCKKEITDAETYWRGNYRYCKTCGGAPKSTVNKNHIKFKENDTVENRITPKCSSCGISIPPNRTKCVSCDWAENKFFNKEIFNMVTKEGQFRKFTYWGYTRYHPNCSSRCGYGSDDWYYLCKEKETYYLLEFSDNPSYGTAWMGIKLLDGDYEKLVEEDVNFWGQIAYSKEREKIYGLKLLDIDAVRELLPTYSRCNHFNDALYTG